MCFRSNRQLLKFWLDSSFKNKNAQTTKDSFENIHISSKRKQNLFKSERGKEFYKSIFQIFLNTNNIKHCFRNTYLGAVFPERFNRTIRNLLKKPVIEKRDSHWIDILPTITKQYNNRILSTTKLTPIQLVLKRTKDFYTKIY